jgi:hypothetical protein
LPPEREPDVLRHIADDPEARALLRLELQAREAWGDAPEVPAGFADRTMAAIEAADTNAEDAAASVGQIAEQVWAWLVGPRTVQVRPGLVAATVALLIGAAVTLWPVAPGPSSGPVTATTSSSGEAAATAVAQDQSEVVWTRFMYANNEASSVAVAGDFSEWEPIPLTEKTVDGQTVWTGLVPVPKGEHQYMFVINGSRWVTDPLAPVQRSDGFGNKNAVLQL